MVPTLSHWPAALAPCHNGALQPKPMSIDNYMTAWAQAFSADVQMIVHRAIREIGAEQALHNLISSTASANVALITKLLGEGSPTEPSTSTLMPARRPYKGSYSEVITKIQELLTQHPGLYGFQIRRELKIDAIAWRAIAGHGIKSPISSVAYTGGEGSDQRWFAFPIH